VRIVISSLANRAPCGWQHTLESPRSESLRTPAYISSDSLPKRASEKLAWHKETATLFSAQADLKGNSQRLDLCLPAPAGQASYTAQLGEHAMQWLEVPVEGKSLPRVPGKRIEVVWDASLSTPTDRSAELRLLSQYLAHRDSHVTLTVLRNDIQRRSFEIRDGDVSALHSAILAEPRDGATALRAWLPAPGVDEVLLFSDAINTWPAGGVPRSKLPVFVISASLGDPALAQALIRQGGDVIELSQFSPSAAHARLLHQSQSRWLLGEQDVAWHAPGLTPQGGVLRACHVSRATGENAQITMASAKPNGTSSTQSLGVKSATANPLASFWCATWWMDSLGANPEAHRTELAELGQHFGIANSETDLLVLERAEDYVRHGIEPRDADQALKTAVLRARQRKLEERAAAVASNRHAILNGWNARQSWWSRQFPKGAPPVEDLERKKAVAVASANATQRERDVRPTGSPAPRATPMAIEVAGFSSSPPASASIAPIRPTASPDAAPSITISLTSVKMDAPYIARLLEARDVTALYQTYLDLREQYAGSPAFYFDVADRLFAMGDAALAQRVLSNIVELLPREHAALRLVAYRLQQAGEHDNALALLERIRQLAPDEPQSFRDLGLALGQTKQPAQCQAAIDQLAHVVNTPWDTRFADIGLIALAELHDQAARCPQAKLDAIDPELRTPLPVGLRVALKWDLNDTDIDLHVTDPNGEMAYYGHQGSYQGGQMSRDFTGGYGPEEFILRDPKPGRYRVQVNYFGSSLAKLTRGAMVHLALQTGFGTAQARSEQVTLRLLEQSGLILAGTFDVTSTGQLQVAPDAENGTSR
jgi:tetratricopeptide (TPR) repeat protein